MISNVKVAAVQMSCSDDREENIAKAERMVRQAASDGANVILLPELFELPYFCQEKNYDYYYLADKTEENPAVKRFMQVAKETGTVIPVSFYEKHGNAFFNTIAMIDCDGSLMGIYRKSHIPDDHFYQEKFYFTPGDTGFKVWNTKFGCIGVGICWDQWFPEAARCMALMGADMLLYPTAIGSEPILECDSMPHLEKGYAGSFGGKPCSRYRRKQDRYRVRSPHPRKSESGLIADLLRLVIHNRCYGSDSFRG